MRAEPIFLLMVKNRYLLRNCCKLINTKLHQNTRAVSGGMNPSCCWIRAVLLRSTADLLTCRMFPAPLIAQETAARGKYLPHLLVAYKVMGASFGFACLPHTILMNQVLQAAKSKKSVSPHRKLKILVHHHTTRFGLARTLRGGHYRP